ncbi:MAG: hypothetical protein M0P27_06495, partial [Bacteroidales bacterium]|nr:hypothetical protein [Bacteroidales bacterium]
MKSDLFLRITPIITVVILLLSTQNLPGKNSAVNIFDCTVNVSEDEERHEMTIFVVPSYRPLDWSSPAALQ